MFQRVVLVGIIAIALGLSRAAFSSQATFSSYTDWGEPTRLTGSLSKPSGQGPFPAVVMLHPCSGISSANGDMWENRLLDWGYVVLRVDSFGPRGLTNVCKYELTRRKDGEIEIFESDGRVEDAYGGKQYLSNLPYVDKDRIGVIGWSHGGSTIMHTVVNGPKPDPFDAVIAFYPSCGNMLTEINAPLLILVGKNDDWTLASVCEQVEQPIFGKDKFVLIIYPGAYHGFDEEDANYKILGRTMLYDPATAANAENQVKAFLKKHMQ